MKRPNFFKRLILSFYSSQYYQDAALYDKGIGLGWVLKVLTFNWLMTILVFTVLAVYLFNSEDFKKNYDEILKQIPEITIYDGKASIKETTPYVVYAPETSQPIIVIDTSDRPMRDDLFYKTSIFITKDRVEVKKSSIETRSYYFKDFDNMVVDSKKLDSMITSILWFFMPFAFLVMMIGSFLFRIIQFFLYTFITMLFDVIFQTELSFRQKTRITAAALTPVLLLDIVFFFLWSGYGVWFFNLFLACIFMGFGVYSNKNSPQELKFG